jgi:hypothetical protein
MTKAEPVRLRRARVIDVTVSRDGVANFVERHADTREAGAASSPSCRDSRDRSATATSRR